MLVVLTGSVASEKPPSVSHHLILYRDEADAIVDHELKGSRTATPEQIKFLVDLDIDPALRIYRENTRLNDDVGRLLRKSKPPVGIK